MADKEQDDLLQELEDTYAQLKKLEEANLKNFGDIPEGYSPYGMQDSTGRLILQEIIVAKANVLAILAPLRQSKANRDRIDRVLQSWTTPKE